LSIKVKKFINKNTTIWDNFINCSNNGTLFHFRSFLNYHENIHFEDHSLIFYKNNILIAVLPATIQNNIFYSHSGISFGSFVYNEKLSFSDAKNIIDSFNIYIDKLHCKAVQITIPPNCYSKFPSNYIEFCLFNSGFKYKKIELSNVLKLGNDFNSLYNAYKSSCRQASRKADRLGIIINQSSDFNAFYKILIKNLSLRHNVSPTHTLSELKKLKTLFPSRINLFTASLNGKIIAGVINFICNENTILAFYISHNSDFQNMRPLNILFTKIFEWGIKNNYKYYDFGIFTVNGKPNLSLARFKESFGAEGIFRKTMILEL